MTARRLPRRFRASLVVLVLASLAWPAFAESADAEGGLRWRLVQPQPPGSSAPCGGEGEPSCPAPVQLGRVGDIEFAAPDKGLLITAGNGSSVPPGVWAYDGSGWHEIASVCGASDGRIAWAGPDEFWTVSDERPGQPANGQGLLPPLEDNTLCHFAANARGELAVARSYAWPAFQASSYQPMLAARCLGAADCWFAGDGLPAPQPGSFHLRWNGAALEADPNPLAARIVSMAPFEGALLESAELPLVEIQGTDEEPLEILHPFVLYSLGAESGGGAFTGLRPFAPGRVPVPEYAPGAFPAALEAFQLSSTGTASGEQSLWAAAGARQTPPAGSAPGALTVLRYAGGSWSQVLGPAGTSSLAATPQPIAEQTVQSVAAEPGGAGAWLALDTHLQAREPTPTSLATVVHVAADGTTTEEQLPSAAERAAGVAPQGPALRVSCPAAEDCWLATARGALFHLSSETHETLPENGDPAFKGAPLTYRPEDEGIPSAQVSTEAGSGEEAGAATVARVEHAPGTAVFRVSVPSYTNARGKLLPGDVLQLSFRLPVRSRVRLLAKRHARVVASTPRRVLAAGRRSVRVRLSPRQWPTSLDLQVSPLSPLPTVPAAGAVNALGTVMRTALPAVGARTSILGHGF